VIFFGPHHDGSAVVLADDDVATVSMTTPVMSAKARSPPRLLWVIVRVLPFILVNFQP
jgi:hypothetical protein